MPVLEAAHLSKWYGKRPAVEDLNFCVEEGHIVGLLGPNGAGKTTTLQLIAGCLAPSRGSVIVCGHDVNAEPLAARRCVGYLPEQPPLYPDMSVREYLGFVAEARGLRGAAGREAVDAAMEKTAASAEAGRLIRHLSKGWRQRVGFAQAILGNPLCVLLDEPTIGLDPAQLAQARALIASLRGRHTVLLSSHILSEVQSLCDQVLILSQGRILAQDTPENLSRRLGGANRLALTARGGREQLRRALSGVPGLQNLRVAPGEARDVWTLEAQSAAGRDLREAVSTALGRAGCPILSMQTRHMELEEIYLRLTGETGETGEAATSADTADAPDAAETADAPAQAHEIHDKQKPPQRKRRGKRRGG